MLTAQGVFCHVQTQRLQSGIDLQVRPRDWAVWREHENGLGGQVDRERVGAPHRVAALAGHAVVATRVGEPQVLSTLSPKAGAGEGMSRGDAPNTRGAQKAHSARQKGPGRHWELPLGLLGHPHPYRASYGE